MRTPFAHQATLELADGSDAGGPGAAVTVRLCGHWEHGGPCRWPHHTAVTVQAGTRIEVRTVFACESDEEGAVRSLIVAGLHDGAVEGGPAPSHWTLVTDAATPLRADEEDLGARLAASPASPVD